MDRTANQSLDRWSIVPMDDSSDGDIILGPPKQIACYSVTATGVEFNATSLRYFVTPPLGANLNNGCSLFMSRYRNVMHQPQRLDSVLLACLQSDSAKEHLLQADVVVRRGVLVKIMLGTKIDLNVSLIDGVLYIEEYAKPKRKYYQQGYVGYGFEALCTTSTNPESEQPTPVKLDVDPDVQWLSMISRQLGDLNIVVAGEVDCIKGRYTGQPDTFFELKARKIVDRPESLSWYRKSYLQSHLLGVSELLVGYHSGNILRRTQLIKVAHMPSTIGQGVRSWNPQIELDRGYAALTAIRQRCSELVQCSGVSDDRVWRVEVMNRTTRIQELTAREAIFDSEKRIGIVPSRVIEVLRRD